MAKRVRVNFETTPEFRDIVWRRCAELNLSIKEYITQLIKNDLNIK